MQVQIGFKNIFARIESEFVAEPVDYILKDIAVRRIPHNADVG